jgi:hypothetical protein
MALVYIFADIIIISIIIITFMKGIYNYIL